MILTALLSISLLSVNATGTERILKKGQAAPFYGVLTDEMTYRGYVLNEKSNKHFEQENAMLSIQNEVIQKRNDELLSKERSVWAWFATGLALGLLVPTVLKSK